MNNVYREAFVFDCALADRKFYLPKDGSMKLQFFHVKVRTYQKPIQESSKNIWIFIWVFLYFSELEKVACYHTHHLFHHFNFLISSSTFFPFGTRPRLLNSNTPSIIPSIRTAGNLLGHFHTGECNRMVPGKGRIPWREIGASWDYRNDKEYKQ